jgi:hypothetical protein
MRIFSVVIPNFKHKGKGQTVTNKQLGPEMPPTGVYVGGFLRLFKTQTE